MREVAPGGQQHGAEALRRPVDGRGQARRSAADHHQVDDLVGAGLIAEPEALGDGTRSGPRHRLALDEGHREVVEGDAVLAERAEVAGRQLDRGMDEVHALGEPAKRHELSRRAGADELQSEGRRPATQHLAPRPQRVQHDVAQLVVLGHQQAQLRAADPQHPSGDRRPRRQERALAVEQPQLADEAARPHPADRRLVDPPEGDAHELDLAGVDEDQVVVEVARLEQVLALGDVLRLAEREQTTPLRIGQGRLHHPLEIPLRQPRTTHGDTPRRQWISVRQSAGTLPAGPGVGWVSGRASGGASGGPST